MTRFPHNPCPQSPSAWLACFDKRPPNAIFAHADRHGTKRHNSIGLAALLKLSSWRQVYSRFSLVPRTMPVPEAVGGSFPCPERIAHHGLADHFWQPCFGVPNTTASPRTEPCRLLPVVLDGESDTADFAGFCNHYGILATVLADVNRQRHDGRSSGPLMKAQAKLIPEAGK